MFQRRHVEAAERHVEYVLQQEFVSLVASKAVRPWEQSFAASLSGSDPLALMGRKRNHTFNQPSEALWLKI